MTDLTLGADLNDRMVPDPDSNPSILPWQATGFRTHYGRGHNFAAGHATLMTGFGEPESWRVYCAGPQTSQFAATDLSSAEEAKAAVEQHILDHIDIDKIER